MEHTLIVKVITSETRNSAYVIGVLTRLIADRLEMGKNIHGITRVHVSTVDGRDAVLISKE